MTDRDWSREDQADLNTPETSKTHIPALIRCCAGEPNTVTQTHTHHFLQSSSLC